MAAESNTHAPERICTFYSKGPHFVRILKRLRAEYPDEIIVAVIPSTFPFDVIEGLADETIRFPEARTAPRPSAACKSCANSGERSAATWW